MSWPLLLSQYQTSILKDNLTPFLLIWLERQGLSTEKEISTDLGIDLIQINKVVLSLYQNRFIEYVGDNLIVSERGRLFIDRLGVTQQILKSISESVKLSDEVTDQLLPLIKTYREESFSNYLKTTWSIRTWNKIISHQKKDIYSKDDFATIGMLAIFLKDLSKWQTGRSTTPWKEKDNNNLLSGIKKWLVSIDFGSAETAAAYQWMEQCKTFSTMNFDIDKIKDKSEALKIFIIYDYFDENLTTKDLNNFWSKEVNYCKNVLNENRIDIIKLTDSACIHWRVKNVAELKDRDKISKSFTRFNKLFHVNDVIDSLLFSSSFEDFTSRSGLSSESATLTLEKIKDRCSSLLSEKRNQSKDRNIFISIVPNHTMIGAWQNSIVKFGEPMGYKFVKINMTYSKQITNKIAELISNSQIFIQILSLTDKSSENNAQLIWLQAEYLAAITSGLRVFRIVDTSTIGSTDITIGHDDYYFSFNGSEQASNFEDIIKIIFTQLKSESIETSSGV